MKLMLFMDDWFLDVKKDIVRRFPQPEPVPVKNAGKLGRCTIIYDEETGSSGRRGATTSGTGPKGRDPTPTTRCSTIHLPGNGAWSVVVITLIGALRSPGLPTWSTGRSRRW